MTGPKPLDPTTILDEDDEGRTSPAFSRSVQAQDDAFCDAVLHSPEWQARIKTAIDKRVKAG